MKSIPASVLALVLVARGVNAFWRISCGLIQTGRIDPVVSYGTVSSHVHKISGASNININSTYDSLQASECTSCTIQADKSAYWTPGLYYAHADGTYEEVPNSGMAVYYLGRGNDNGQNFSTFPQGLKMLSGNNAARSYDSSTLTVAGGRPVADRVSFACIDYNNPQPETPGMTNIKCPDGLRAQIQMQSCWDGVNLYKADQSHVAYLSQIDNGVCPPGYPVLLPHLFYEVLYSMDAIDTSDGGRYMFANGDDTGYGFHGDFINGWDNDVLEDAIANCLVQNPSGVVESCSSFSASNNPDASSDCPERSPVYPCEKVHGVMPNLPGCSTSGSTVSCPGGVQPTCAANYDTYGLSAFPGNDQWSLIGCYTEATSGRALTAKSYSDSSNMTVESCLSYCSGYQYAGVEYGQECYCGNSLSAGSVNTTMSDCSMECKGNQYETCGAGNRLNMYQMKAAASSSVSSSASISTSTSVSAFSSVSASSSSFSSVITLPSSSLSSSISTATSSTFVTSIRASSSTSSSAPVATGPSIVQSVGNYNYYGCYTEASSGRALSLASTSNNQMTVEACASYCGSYPMFGVEYGRECYCGSYLRSGSTLAPATDCKMACSGGATEYCGAGSRLNVYAVNNYIKPSIPPTIGNYKYAGCYTEPSSGRALPSASTVDYNAMTLNTCASFCQSYNYFGVEYAGECWCGNSLSSGSTIAPNGDSECSSTCPGNYTQLACGAGSRLSVYRRSNVTLS